MDFDGIQGIMLLCAYVKSTYICIISIIKFITIPGSNTGSI